MTKANKTGLPSLDVSVLGIAIFILLTTFYPLVAVIPWLTGVPSNPISVSYRLVYLLLSIVVIVFGVYRIQVLKFSWGGYALIIFWFLYIIRLVYDLSIRDIKIYESDFYFYTFGIGGCFIPAVALLISMPRVNKMLLVKFFLLFSFLVNLAVFLQLGFFYGFGVEIFTVRARIGENGVNIFNPIGVSKEGANLAIFSLFFLLFKKHRLFRRSKIILLLTFMLGLLNLLLGASRGPTASFLLVVISMVLYNLYVARKSLRYMFNVSAVMGGIAFVIMQYVIPAINNGAFSLAKRVAQATDKGFGEEVRAYQWRAAWEQIKSSPIWGERMVENYLNHSPHNLYIEIMLATGIVGTLVFLFSVAVFARKFISALIVQDIMLVFFFLATAQFLFGLSGLSIPTGWHFWSFLALCLTFSTKRSDHNYA